MPIVLTAQRAAFSLLLRRVRSVYSGSFAGPVFRMMKLMAADFVVYVVDDDPDLCRLCAHLLSTVGIAVETFPSAEEFLSRPPGAVQPGSVLLTDVRMPGISGLELVERLSVSGPDLAMIVYSGYADVPMAVRALKAGAVEFIEKPFNQQQLLETIGQAREHSKRLRSEKIKRSEVLGRLASLSPREREVFGLVVQGKANKIVAAELGLSEKTIEIHRANVMRKMQAESFAHLVRMAVAVEAHSNSDVLTVSGK